MEKAKKFTFLIAILVGFVITVAAQETGEERYVQNIIRVLERSNWETSEIGALERHLFAYEWKNLSGIDPDIVVQALSYGKDRGIDTPEDLAQMAYQLSLSIGEMLRLGLEPRDILRASLNAVRKIATVRLGYEGEQIPDLAQTLREQIQLQRAGIQKVVLRRQAERRGPGLSSPAHPDERAGGGSPNLPSGPGNPPGPSYGSFGEDRGR